jgi:hypothetical protein
VVGALYNRYSRTSTVVKLPALGLEQYASNVAALPGSGSNLTEVELLIMAITITTVELRGAATAVEETAKLSGLAQIYAGARFMATVPVG